MTRARIYVRCSRDEQGSFSLVAQEREARRWCADREQDVVGVYSDKGLSGVQDERSVFQLLLKDAKAEPGSIIVVYKFDRLARNTDVILRIVYKELLPKQVKLFSVLEAFYS